MRLTEAFESLRNYKRTVPAPGRPLNLRQPVRPQFRDSVSYDFRNYPRSKERDAQIEFQARLNELLLQIVGTKLKNKRDDARPGSLNKLA